MAYNKRYRVTHTFADGSRFIGTIGIRNATPDFPENIEGRMIVESVNGRFQGVFKLVNGTVGRVSGVVLPPQPKKLDLRATRCRQVSAKRDRAECRAASYRTRHRIQPGTPV